MSIKYFYIRSANLVLIQRKGRKIEAYSLEEVAEKYPEIYRKVLSKTLSESL